MRSALESVVAEQSSGCLIQAGEGLGRKAGAQEERPPLPGGCTPAAVPAPPTLQSPALSGCLLTSPPQPDRVLKTSLSQLFLKPLFSQGPRPLVLPLWQSSFCSL